MPIKVNCWNEYDTLKTVILGNVYDLDRIPRLYEGADQTSFEKIIEETAAELSEIKTVLEQHDVRVLQPKQPLDYHNIDPDQALQQSPLMNMRDFYLAYGEWFFMTFGSYSTRRYQHFWAEDIVNQLISDGNIVVSANEPNLQPLDWNKYKQTGNWGKAYDESYADKNLVHTACLLKYNNIAFIRERAGTEIGKTWLTKLFSLQGIKTITVPGEGHLDACHSILNKRTVLINTTDIRPWVGFKNIIRYDDSKYQKYRDSANQVAISRNPTEWLQEWRGYAQEFDNVVNCLSLSPNKVMLSVYDKDLDRQLKDIGIDTVYVKWSNRVFWEGGLHCITCDIERTE